MKGVLPTSYYHRQLQLSPTGSTRNSLERVPVIPTEGWGRELGIYPPTLSHWLRASGVSFLRSFWPAVQVGKAGAGSLRKS